jgi:hypothetical protein
MVTAFVVAFQLALAMGAPWGTFAMGGAFPGVFPPALRVGAVLQALLLVFLAFVVFSRTGMVPRRRAGASDRLIWLVIALSAFSLVLNLITPSKGERVIWAPVAAVLLACSVTVAVASGRSSAVSSRELHE